VVRILTGTAVTNTTRAPPRGAEVIALPALDGLGLSRLLRLVQLRCLAVIVDVAPAYIRPVPLKCRHHAGKLDRALREAVLEVTLAHAPQRDGVGDRDMAADNQLVAVDDAAALDGARRIIGVGDGVVLGCR
jgi:hypothetical protein